ncbi:MAG: hypothetical protein ACI8WB_004080 [Phenylobacterium sp.]
MGIHFKGASMKNLVLLLMALWLGGDTVVTASATIIEKPGYIAVVGYGTSNEKARLNALANLSESLFVEVSSRSVLRSSVTQTFEQEFSQKIQVDSHASLYGVTTETLTSKGDERVVEARINIAIAAKVYINLLPPLVNKINTGLAQGVGHMPALKRVGIYYQKLELVQLYEQYQQLFLILEAHNQNWLVQTETALSEAFRKIEKPLISLQSIVTDIGNLKEGFTSNMELAGHLLSWDFVSTQMDNVHVCPVFGQKGQRLDKQHIIPATLWGRIHGSVDESVPQSYLIGTAILMEGGIRIEYKLVDPDKNTPKSIAYVKVKLAEGGWKNPENTPDKTRVLFESKQYFCEVKKNFAECDGVKNAITIDDHTSRPAKKLLAGIFKKSTDIQWISPDNCVDKAGFSNQKRISYYNVEWLVEIDNKTVKAIETDIGEDLIDMPYARANVNFTLRKGKTGEEVLDLNGEGGADSSSGVNIDLLKESTLKALQQIVSQNIGDF